MKKLKTLSEQVENLLKKNKTPAPDTENEENSEFIDINKSIEKMLTAKTDKKNKQTLNL